MFDWFDSDRVALGHVVNIEQVEDFLNLLGYVNVGMKAVVVIGAENPCSRVV